MSAEIDIRAAARPEPDTLIVQIADYVCNYQIQSDEAWQTAHYCLKDSLASGLLAMRFPECVKLLGPIVPGADLPGGARVPATHFELDPVQAAFNIGVLVRYLDFNDTWLAAEWGHPSDNLGAILAVADYISRNEISEGREPLPVKAVLEAMIKAHEIQGVLALKNSFNRVGLDHVLLVRIASTAVVTHMLGGSRDDVINAVSQAWDESGLPALPTPHQRVLMEDFKEAAMAAGRYELTMNAGGQGAGAIFKRRPAAEIFNEILDGTREALDRLKAI